MFLLTILSINNYGYFSGNKGLQLSCHSIIFYFFIINIQNIFNFRFRGPSQERNFRNGSREQGVGLYRNQSRERSGTQESWRKNAQPPAPLQQNGRKETKATREVDNNKDKQENITLRKDTQDSGANRDNVSKGNNSNPRERENRDTNVSSGNSPGILVIPPNAQSPAPLQQTAHNETPTYTSVVTTTTPGQSEPYRPPPIASRHLYDPNNPDKPIVVPTPCSRVLTSVNQ